MLRMAESYEKVAKRAEAREAGVSLSPHKDYERMVESSITAAYWREMAGEMRMPFHTAVPARSPCSNSLSARLMRASAPRRFTMSCAAR